MVMHTDARETSGRLREAPGGSGKLRAASGTLREAPGSLREAPGSLREAPRSLREAPGGSGQPPGGSGKHKSDLSDRGLHMGLAQKRFFESVVVVIFVFFCSRITIGEST